MMLLLRRKPEQGEQLCSLQIDVFCPLHLQNYLQSSGHESLILQCLFMTAFSYLTSACFHIGGFANPLIFGPVPYRRGTS